MIDNYYKKLIRQKLRLWKKKPAIKKAEKIGIDVKEISYEEWIIITPGSKGEELIKNLEDIKCIYAFFIYCGNIELHEKWTKNINQRKASQEQELLL